MSLGVLNNLSAVYAENALNNTNNSLGTVLQQLSSGSKINSGADDAAGLSLVDGLQANQSALMQSQTNATEGVGLLQVADGALSQVTSLLNRAVTLATEASNGTLNSTQDTAANQEYQSILSEVSNIGSTTTYNQEQVFNSNTNIYTGDSSSQGSSIDDLNIRSLSSSNLGDTSGVMSYSNGTNNVFLDLSEGGTNAAVTDSLGLSTATTTIAVNYVGKGANGSAIQETANVSAGAGTNYANTARGLIDAINGSGLGLTASFGTAAQAGTAAASGAAAANTTGGGGTDTGIIISGSGVGTGTNGAGEVGTLSMFTAGSTLSSGTISITGSDGTTHNLTLGLANSTDTMANLAATINSAGYGVTASVNAAAVGTQAAGTVLTFTSADSSVTVGSASLVDSTNSHDLTLSNTPTIGNAQFNNTIGTIITSNANQAYTGGTLSIGANATITLGTAGTTDSAVDLAKTINAGNYGVTASLNQAAVTINGTSYAAGEVLSFTSANASDTFKAAATVGAGTVTSTVNAANQSQVGEIDFAGGATVGADVTTAGAKIEINGNTVLTEAAASTVTAVITAFNDLNLGITASLKGGNIDFASTSAATIGDNITSSAITDTTTTKVGTAVSDTPATGNSAYYSVGVTGSIADTTTGGGTPNVGVVADNNGSNGVATISYSDAAGQSLSNSDLSSAADAQATLNDLNLAISDVAAQDGYVGAQINTLNSVSSVIGTQQENVQSAQNAVQATDYASATSNMSKYEILSQTGIAALAQANSQQQDVLKLLQ